jgi:hypothetical protein
MAEKSMGGYHNASAPLREKRSRRSPSTTPLCVRSSASR